MSSNTNSLRQKIKIMHVSVLSSHPCFSDLLKLQKEKYELFFVKLNLINQDIKYEVIKKQREKHILVKNVKKCYDQSYDKKLRDIFNELFKEFKPNIIHIQLLSGISLLPVLNAASSLAIKKVLTLHDHSLFCVRGICHDGKSNCRLDSLDKCNCRECLLSAYKNGSSLYVYNRARRQRAKNIINQADKIICPSNQQREQLITLFGNNDKFITLYYGVKLPSYQIKKRPHLKPVFGYLGTMAHIKGINLIEMAIRRLKNYNFKVLMGLTCDLNNNIEREYWERLHSYEKVILKENIIRGNLYEEFFSQIDYLIIPSMWNETGPMTLFESLYYKVPVIVSNNQSMLEKLRGSKSSKVFNNVSELANTMKSIIHQKSNKKKKDKFKVKDIAQYYKEIDSVYKEIINKRRKGLFLKLGYKCNNNCIFCVTGDNYPREFVDFENIKNTLIDNSKKCDSVVLTGGEPTIRNDFFKIMELSYILGYKIILQTNARMFNFMQFCNGVKKYSLEFMININGHNAKIHNATTRTEGSFEQTITGIKNLQKYGFKITAKVMLTKMNYEYLLETVKYITELGIPEIWFVFLTPYGYARVYFEKVVPKYSEVMYFVNRAIMWLKNNSGIKIGLEGFPYCCLNPRDRTLVTEEAFTKDSLDGIYPDGYSRKYNCKYERIFNQKQKLNGCNICRYEKVCEGVYKEYINRNGTKEFKPIS